MTVIAIFCAVNAIVGILTFYFVCYAKMLNEASTPWFLQRPIGEVVLYLLFTIGSWIRRYFPDASERGSQQGGKTKAKLLKELAPGPGGVCFVGSSTFTFWRQMAHDFKSLGCSIINAGFGGSCTNDLLPLVDSLCCDFKPKVIVYFCGSNNLTQNLGAWSPLEGFELFLSKAWQRDPTVQVIYLGITITPFYTRWNINNCMHNANISNKAVQQYISANPDRLTYVHTDSVDCAFARDPAYYLGDSHHLNDEGHKLLADRVLLPAIRAALQRSKK
jgi:hypothetical protein